MIFRHYPLFGPSSLPSGILSVWMRVYDITFCVKCYQVFCGCHCSRCEFQNCLMPGSFVHRSLTGLQSKQQKSWNCPAATGTFRRMSQEISAPAQWLSESTWQASWVSKTEGLAPPHPHSGVFTMERTSLITIPLTRSSRWEKQLIRKHKLLEEQRIWFPLYF